MKRLYFSLIAMIAFVGFAALALADPGRGGTRKSTVITDLRC